ncbi:hypothetical protein KP509_17G072700 [Ceratopteris richardii]|nr:hypothetical protein KP509_17G072700 [Ceratopteris richardii]
MHTHRGLVVFFHPVVCYFRLPPPSVLSRLVSSYSATSLSWVGYFSLLSAPRYGRAPLCQNLRILGSTCQPCFAWLLHWRLPFHHASVVGSRFVFPHNECLDHVSPGELGHSPWSLVFGVGHQWHLHDYVCVYPCWGEPPCGFAIWLL